jgi:hypothetical protein
MIALLAAHGADMNAVLADGRPLLLAAVDRLLSSTAKAAASDGASGSGQDAVRLEVVRTQPVP